MKMKPNRKILGENYCYFWKTTARRLPFHLLFSFVVNAPTELTKQIKRNIREQINQAVVPTWTLIMLEAGEGLECQQQQQCLPKENCAGHTIHSYPLLEMALNSPNSCSYLKICLIFLFSSTKLPCIPLWISNYWSNHLPQDPSSVRTGWTPDS